MSKPSFQSLPYDIHTTISPFLSVETVEALLQTSTTLRSLYDPIANCNKQYFLKLAEQIVLHTLGRGNVHVPDSQVDLDSLYRLLIWRGVEWIKQIALAMISSGEWIQQQYRFFRAGTGARAIAPGTSQSSNEELILVQNLVRMELITTVFYLLDSGPFPTEPYSVRFGKDEDEVLEVLNFILTTPLFGDGSVWDDGRGRWWIEKDAATGEERTKTENQRPISNWNESQFPNHLKHLLYLGHSVDDNDKFVETIRASGHVKAFQMVLSYIHTPDWLVTHRPSQCAGPEFFEGACLHGNSGFARYLLDVFTGQMKRYRNRVDINSAIPEGMVGHWVSADVVAEIAVDLPARYSSGGTHRSQFRLTKYEDKEDLPPPRNAKAATRTWMRWRMEAAQHSLEQTRANPQTKLESWNERFAALLDRKLDILDLLRYCDQEEWKFPRIFFRTLFKPDLFTQMYDFRHYTDYPKHILPQKSDSDLHHWLYIEGILRKLLVEYKVDPNISLTEKAEDFWSPHYDENEIFPSVGNSALGRVMFWIFECGRSREEEGHGVGLEKAMKVAIGRVLRLLDDFGAVLEIEEADAGTWSMLEGELKKYWGETEWENDVAPLVNTKITSPTVEEECP
ncbi:hypothetical protein BJ508DRAFT_379121 [Ascobolus immersus RN42]|uniref:F-box domain-containing protein n=1 Tax=Ascobolus immersus RN42 TaxID=1160509 RepID=A0A3N4HZ16_ASCIM|nr:hypothetical protein BJ508DRAFT_379121 [Ascobolus immersus RN42]